MLILVIAIVVIVAALIVLALSLRIVKQYEQGVLFRLGRVIGVLPAGLTFIIPVVDVLRRVSLRIVTMPFWKIAKFTLAGALFVAVAIQVVRPARTNPASDPSAALSPGFRSSYPRRR